MGLSTPDWVKNYIDKGVSGGFNSSHPSPLSRLANAKAAIIRYAKIKDNSALRQKGVIHSKQNKEFFMKKEFFVFIIITVLLIGCATQSSTPANVAANVSVAEELDPAIREASDYLNTKIPKGRKAVFLLPAITPIFRNTF